MKHLERAQRVLRDSEQRLNDIAAELETAQIALAESAADEAAGDRKRAGERAQAEKIIERLEKERAALAAALPILKQRHEEAVIAAAPEAEARLADALASHNSKAKALAEQIEATRRELLRLETEYQGLQNCTLSQRLGAVRAGEPDAILAALE